MAVKASATAAGCVVLAALLAMTASPAHAATTVMIMRHCARTTPNGTYGGPLPNANNYTALPWPAWPDNLAPYLCLPNGVTILQGTGRWLAENGKLPEPIAFTADKVTRDETTAAAVVHGLGWKGQVEVNHAPFGSACPRVDHKVADAAVKANWAKHPAPPNHDDLLAELQSITGMGVAPALKDIPDTVHHGYFDGGDSIAEQETERFVMELGGNMTVAWNHLSSPFDVYRLYELHAWQRRVNDIVPETQRNYGASITWHLVNSLSNGEAGTQFFVGHDSQQWSLAATLGLVWTPDSLPTLPTLPGSMLRFDLDGDSVTANYLYPLFTDRGASQGRLYSTPAVFDATGTNKVSLEQLTSISKAAIDPTCVQH